MKEKSNLVSPFLLFQKPKTWKNIEFAWLIEKEAELIIKLQELPEQEYHTLWNYFCKGKESYNVQLGREGGWVLEEQNIFKQGRIEDKDYVPEPMERAGLIHGLWVPMERKKIVPCTVGPSFFLLILVSFLRIRK